MKCANIVFFLTGFVSLLTAGEHGLLPLKDRERNHLENNVPKVVNVQLNSLGVARLQEYMAENPSLEPQEFSVGDEEFSQMTLSTEAALQQIPLQATLPTSVNNSVLAAFPPIGNQGQIGSCVAWGSTYYQATHEIGLLNQVNNKSGQQGILSPKWTYDILNGGADNGLSVLTAYQLLSTNGATTLARFPYDTNYTAWDLNSQDWVEAISNRMATYALIPGLGGSSAQNLTAIKTALVNGHVLTFATFIDSWVFTNIKNDPQNIDNNYVGDLAAIYMNGEDGGHFLTIIGYDDNLWIDVNGNGEVDPGERGAFLIANSWGTSWGNAGYVWISYDAFLAASGVSGGPNKGRVAAGTYLNSNVITVVPKAQNYTPSLIAQFSLSQTERNQFAIQAGISSTSATTPTTTLSDYALTNQGGALEFSGANPGSAQSLTFALDYTDLLASAASGTASRYYLTVNDNEAGPATALNSYTLIDLVHNNQISASNLPKTYDNSSGSVYIDYNFSQGVAPTPITPTVSFTSPQSGATLSGTVSVSANASDSLGIASLQLYIDTTLVGAMTESSGSYTASLNTASFSNGSHQLKIVATDTENNTAQSLLTVQIDNTVALPSFYVNAGGPALSSQGETWTVDTGYFSGSTGTYMNGLPFANPVYQTVRYDNMTYRFTVPNGAYSVTLKNAEIYFQKKNQRVFNVAINGTTVITRLDLFAAAGFGVPYDLTFPVTVTNGAISIVFTSVINNAQVSAIEIVPAVAK